MTTTPNRYELLRNMILGHQYGLRGFGDGSLSRGRDLTTWEQQTITEALKTAAWRDAEIARLQAQVAELQADAQRYRHLRNQEAIDFPPKHGSVWVIVYEHPGGTIPSMASAGHGERLDANVDAAIAAAGR